MDGYDFTRLDSRGSAISPSSPPGISSFVLIAVLPGLRDRDLSHTRFRATPIGFLADRLRLPPFASVAPSSRPVWEQQFSTCELSYPRAVGIHHIETKPRRVAAEHDLGAVGRPGRSVPMAARQPHHA